MREALNVREGQTPCPGKEEVRLRNPFALAAEDVRTALERDPAARSWFGVVTNYAGVHAIWAHRLNHALWGLKWYWLARFLAQIARFLTGIEIHPGAKIGRRVFIDHGMGVVIGETAEVGNDVTLYHGVTLGGVSLAKVKRHPTLEEGVVVGAGAKILGDIVIGSCSRIGANAVVVKPVPPHSVVVGVPGQVIRKAHEPEPGQTDLQHADLPDAIVDYLKELNARLEVVEGEVLPDGVTHHRTRLSEDGSWEMDDPEYVI